MNYFSKHWRGELSLPVSYWINYAGLGAVIGVLQAFQKFSPLELLLLVGASVWSVVGTWRAASKRQGGWGTVVHVVVVLGLLSAAGQFMVAVSGVK